MWLLNTRSSATQESGINYTYCYHWRFGGFSWINQNIFSDSLPDYYHPWCEEHSCMWSREHNPAPHESAQVQEQKLFTEHLDSLTHIGIKPENSMHHLYPRETWLDCKEGKSGGKPINFRLYLGVLWCCSGQAAKTAEGGKLLSSWSVPRMSYKSLGNCKVPCRNTSRG